MQIKRMGNIESHVNEVLHCNVGTLEGQRNVVWDLQLNYRIGNHSVFDTFTECRLSYCRLNSFVFLSGHIDLCLV